MADATRKRETRGEVQSLRFTPFCIFSRRERRQRLREPELDDGHPGDRGPVGPGVGQKEAGRPAPRGESTRIRGTLDPRG